MLCAALWLFRLVAFLTAINFAAVGVSVALVGARAAEPVGIDGNARATDPVRRSIERRVVEAVIWGMPAVNYDIVFR